ncbi:MAG: hypothetical protein HY013_21635 [Candidatus Solibacter usitatus]|nr:hypothetical protein [Candidatus Solibacter usitatus]
MNVQHVKAKIFARESSGIDLGEAIPVFHQWIQKNSGEELLIDVADYRHVPGGPGVMLIGHDAHWSLDSARNRLGLVYNRRTAMEGSTGEKLRQAVGAALEACRRLEQEAPFRGKLVFDGGECEIAINDRLLAPNTEETYRALKSDFEWLFDALWGPGAYTMEHAGEARELFQVVGKARTPVAAAELALAP